MSVIVDPNPHLVFEPRSGADFKPVDIAIPGLAGHQDELSFFSESRATVREACGNAACRAEVLISSSLLPNNSIMRIVQSATIECLHETCPLVDPPSSNDNEPLVPVPNPPTLKAHAEVA